MTFKNKLGLLAAIVLLWIVAALLISLHEYFFLFNYPDAFDSPALSSYSFGKNLIAAVAALTFGGLIFGLLEILYYQNQTKRKKFIYTFLSKITVYTLLMLTIIIAISYLYNTVLSGRPLFDLEGWQLTKKFISSPAFWHPVTPFIVLAIISSFLVQLAERIGVTEFWQWISGRYFQAKEENRFFMFLDLTASTSIAERLGNQKFYEYLNDFFQDISTSIVRNKGEVVDYVGDQVIISWTLEAGIKEGRCLSCFKDFEKDISQRAEYYQTQYGTVPKFKAAVHCGHVMIGEIGKLKKSIKYSGDVLNTTSRIEHICKQIGAKLATSGHVVELIDEKLFNLEITSPISLKGKEETVAIYKVQ